MPVYDMPSDLDTFFNALAQGERAALANLTPAQKSVMDGTHPCFLRKEGGYEIYGKVMDPLGYWHEEYPDGIEDPEIQEEYRAEAEMAADTRARGYVFARCYSRICPRGELGDTHVSRITRALTLDEFEAAIKIEICHIQ